MRQVIPFSKEIVFKTNVASITSISLEHEEKIYEGEVSGDFIIFGDYKAHNDTTERELFKYRLPFTTLIPDNIKPETIFIDVINFTYEQVEEDVIKVNIDFSVEGEEYEVLDNIIEPVREEELNVETDVEVQGNSEEKEYSDELDEMLNRLTLDEAGNILKEDIILDNVIEENKIDNESHIDIEENNSENVILEEKKESDEEMKNISEEYVTYHIHIVKSEENIDSILKMYDGNLDTVKEYNDLTNINIGDKIIIPEYLDE